MFESDIEGMKFIICTEACLEYYTSEPTGQWRAWCFFAYNKDLNIYPADSLPNGVETQESITSEYGNTQDLARQAVEAKLREVIRSKSLEGTGFYSPPADKVFPQEFPGRRPTDLE